MHTLDIAVIVTYGLIVVAVGAWAHRRQRKTDDYLLGGRALPWWAVGVSIMATSFSSAALVGGSGMGFASGMAYLGLQLGDLLAFGLAMVLLLPAYRKQPITTAYELLETRLGVVARVLASLIFVAQTLVRIGLLVYAPALILSILLGCSVATAILVTAAAALLYSSFGGISAVVWTDMIQVGAILVGGAATLVVLAGDVPGGWSAMWAYNAERGATAVFQTGKSAGEAFSLPWILIAYGVLALSVAGTNQQTVQRYLACQDLKAARKAAILGWGIGAVAVALSLLVGTAIAAWAAAIPGSLPADVKPDQALGHVILHRLPAGLAGLLVVAIFAAAMSSLDSAIHSLSTAVLVDGVRRFRREPLGEAAELRLARGLTATFGGVAAGVALLAAWYANDTLLNTMLLWLGFFAGPLLGLFLLALWGRVTEAGAVFGTLAAFAWTAYAATHGVAAQWGVHKLYLVPAALGFTLGAALIADPLFRRAGARVRKPVPATEAST